MTFVAGLWIGGPSGKREPDPPVILKQVQALSELATIKYVMSKVVTHEIEKTFGRDKILLVGQGVVKAGIDLGKVTAQDVRVSGTGISLHLPKTAVTDAYLDEKQTFVYDRRTGFFVRPDKDLETEARRMAREAILTAAHASGIHKEAEARAREVIGKVLMAAGFERVEFY
ncbi:MAG: DUF4230 domain-containing protein [Betaproteobacteria bacterium]|nr:DUF4230 domain-containing protein [Betaproteobacteria bacterium]